MKAQTERVLTTAPRNSHTLTLKVASLAASVADHILGFPEVDRLYHSVTERSTGSTFCRGLLDQLDLKVQVTDEDLARVPTGGPAVVVANHPFGLLDPIILYVTLRALRPDVKVITNSMLSSVRELKDFCIFVDPFGGPQAQRANARAVRETMEWLSNGGMVVMFPAGEVAALTSRTWQVSEPEWNSSCVRFASKTNAAVVPVLFKGTNCPVFHLAGLVHPRLRTALLPYELLNKRKMEIRLAIGHSIPSHRLDGYESPEQATGFLRQRTFHLKNRWKIRPLANAISSLSSRSLPAVKAHPRAGALSYEVESLPRECVMLESSDVKVYCAAARQIPEMLFEIGRQREITFRQTGEGSGREIDLDEFDHEYLHLFSWHTVNKELIGAYRLGPTDRVRPNDGLYVRSLFKIHPRLMNQLVPGLELGRSFVRQKYQRSPSALALLWKGLARYVSLNPQYHLLFGPVSISKDYTAASHQLIVRYLERQCYDATSAAWVKARTPFRRVDALPFTGRLPMLEPQSVDELTELVSDLEADGKGVPVLVREYLRLGGRVLGFNVDPHFSNVVDALIMVDLTKTPKRVLDRYMGRDEAAAFSEYHARMTVSTLSRLLAA
ncbi:MAG: lysophospholipid acyltransferase family protein [bacterium]|nr:lysophospholipid acyltransferase family protein [bacterium]